MSELIKKHQQRMLSADTQDARKAFTPDFDYEVKRDGDDVVLGMGLAPEIRMPVNDAIKLALLILKKAGVQVDHG